MVSLVGVVLAVVAAICLAGQALTIRLATRRGRSNDVLLVVMLVNVVVFVPLAVVQPSNPNVTPVAVVAFVAAGIVGTILGRALFYAGIKSIGASRAEPIKASMPLHATVLAVLFLGEVVTGLQLAGVALIVVGIALVSWEGSNADRIAGDGVPWTGLALPLAAAFFFGLEPIFATVGLAEGTPVIVGLTIKTVSALAVFVLYLGWRGSLPTRSGLPTGDVRWYVAAGLASTGFLLAYYAALEVSRVSVVVPIMQTSPLIVVLVSAALLHGVERVTPKLVAAAGIIVVGGILVTLFG
ncbi:EamA family transporter [Natronorarus salvus]|uniref:EamA family transporter n=1 Tax=Natronorarus salvus TaxID=3117733 RepID=UPI002F260BF5